MDMLATTRYLLSAVFLLGATSTALADEEKTQPSEGNLRAYANMVAVGDHKAKGTVLVRRKEKGSNLELEFEDVPTGNYSLMLVPAELCPAATNSRIARTTEEVVSKQNPEQTMMKLGSFKVDADGKLETTVESEKYSADGPRSIVGEALVIVNARSGAGSDDDDLPPGALACGVIVDPQDRDTRPGVTPSVAPAG